MPGLDGLETTRRLRAEQSAGRLPRFPVIALSVNPAQTAKWHYRLGQALAPLRAEGVLVVGSGGFSHNLRASRALLVESAHVTR